MELESSINVVDCKQLSKNILSRIKDMIQSSTKIPHLAVLQIGYDPASNVYIKHKRKVCLDLNMEFTHKQYDSNISENDFLQEIEYINQNTDITGYIVQVPIPKHISLDRVINKIDPKKDIDCFHYDNMGLMLANRPRYIAATPYGIVKLIDHCIDQFNFNSKGKTCVIISKSDIVGKPLQILLACESTYAFTTISCDRYTEDLHELVRLADVLIVAAGVHNLIDSTYEVKSTSIIIDVGIHRIKKDEKTVLAGDVNYDYFVNKCKYITPVPGGVGPLTIASLMYNLYLSTESNN